MEIFKYLVLLFIGLVLLIVFSDIFVDASSSLAIKMKVPKMLIAITIAAFGTCAPELAISFNSIASANAELTLANVIGSCIVNILLIIGVSSFLHPIKVKDKTIKNELPILLCVTGAFFILLSDSFFGKSRINGLSRADAGILILWFSYFMYYVIRSVRHNKEEVEDKPKYNLISSIILIIVSIILIVFASDLVVDNASLLASSIGISQKIIAMTVIVIGTSLPELTMTVISAKKGEFDMAVGNIIGTNIFNICIVLGLPILIYGDISSPSFNVVDSIVVLTSALMYYLFGKSNKELSRREGLFMIILFLVYYLYLFIK